jgi:hypothetical protein
MPKDFVQIPELLRALDWRVSEVLDGEPIDSSDWLSDDTGGDDADECSSAGGH